MAWLQYVLQATPDYAIVLADAQGVIVDWLGAAEHVFGYTADEARGQPLAMLFTPEDRDSGLDRQEREMARAIGRSEDDRWQLRKGDVRFWASGVMQPVKDKHGALLGYCKILRDRTDFRTRLDALANRAEALTGELARRTEFMVRLGHELRNPLAAIRTAGYTLQRVGGDVVERPCQVLERQVTVLVRLLDDLAEATRADAHRTRILPQRLVLQDALQLAASSMQAAVSAKRQHLAVVVPHVPITIEADPARLQQMLLNLLSNANKFTPEEGHLSLGATVEGEMAVIHVQDDGVGIPDDVRPHIFELFTRASTTASTAEGLGVGLAVVKELATLHGGGVEARSAVEGGTVFTLRLPVRQKTTVATQE
jgi:PAS domain S-box-containing protein